MKHCKKCKQTKSEDNFYQKRYPNGKIGLRAYCKECGTKDRNAWRAASPKDNERNKAYNREHAEEIRGKKLVKNYWPHLTWQQAITEWNRMYQEQGGVCFFGHKTETLHVDHCHATGKIRGLLCYNCNDGLGRFKDDIEVLEKAIDYLKSHAILST